MNLIRWIFSLAILSVWGALIGTVLYMALYADPETPTGSAIVVLSGNPSMSGETAQRVDRAIALYQSGSAPVLVMSGGTQVDDLPPIAHAMRERATAAGVPLDAVLVEDGSHSTLQNALFSADISSLNTGDPILLVTHRYHLPRAFASFRWAGFSKITNVAADPNDAIALSEGVFWEGLKWPINFLRATAASAANAGGVPRESYIKYLE